MNESLKQRTAKGLFWGAMNSGTTQVLNLVIGIFLGRLLSPTDYGIVGVLTIFTTLAGNLQSSGFTQGLINLKHPTDRDYNAVFTFNVFMSVSMYALLFFCAPFIAQYFHQPCLVDVSRVVFLTFLIASLGIAHGGYLTKNMMNKEIAIIGAIALLTSGAVGIILAIILRNYWALAWQQLTYITVINLGRYYFVREWRPRLTINLSPIRQMFSFSVKILFTTILNTLSGNILTVIFGRLFPIHQVGNYSQAYKWNTMSSSLISNTIGQIAQTVMVETAQEEEEGRELRVFRKMMRFTCFLSMPLMFGFALVAREFIIITVGKQWLECVPMLQVFCLSGAFLPLYTMYQNLSISRGRSDIYLWLNIGQIVIQISLILALHSYGMLTMVSAYSAFLLAWLMPWHITARRLIRYRLRDAAADVLPFTLAATIVMASVYLVTMHITHPWLLIAVRFVLASFTYYIIMKLLRVQILHECEQFVMKAL